MTRARESKGGRPTAYTPEAHEKIVASIRAGNFRETAAAAAGIDSKTLRNWLKRGAKGRQPYKRFAEDVETAEAESEARDVALIAMAGRKDWKALAWRLEHRFPERWGQRTRHEHSGPDGAPIPIDARSQLLEKVAGMVKKVGSDE